MLDLQQTEKPIRAQQVYDALCRQYGRITAEEIMDGLEGHPDDYAGLVKIIREGKLDLYARQEDENPLCFFIH